VNAKDYFEALVPLIMVQFVVLLLLILLLLFLSILSPTHWIVREATHSDLRLGLCTGPVLGEGTEAEPHRSHAAREGTAGTQ
jgi:hypothetical protein